MKVSTLRIQILKNCLVYCSCGTFLYRERLQQQNGDMRKRDGVKTMCIWLYLVQGRVYSSLSPPSPFKCNNKGSWPALLFHPPPPTLP